MTTEQADRLIIGQQVFFCGFSCNDDVSAVCFGTGAYCGRIDDGRISISTGKGPVKAAGFQTFLTLNDLTAYLKRYFSIVHEKVVEGEKK